MPLIAVLKDFKTLIMNMRNEPKGKRDPIGYVALKLQSLNSGTALYSGTFK